MISTSHRVINLFALSILAVTLATLFKPSLALSSPGSRFLELGRQHNHIHHARLQAAGQQQLKRRANSKKCRSRFSSSSVASPTTHHDPPKSTAEQSTPKPTQSHSSGSPPSGGTGSGLDFFHGIPKLGIAWADGGANYLSNLAGAKMIYTWGPTCPSDADKLGMACFPQLWGQKDLDSFKKVSQTAKPPIFLTFNEPQEKGQSNMDVGSGIQLWKEAVKPLTDRGAKVCSPATSSNPNGMDWVKQFQKDCPECTWDVTCIHWYDTTFEKFQTYVQLWHDTFGKPVLVTEFGVQNFNGGSQPTSGEVFDFMNKAIPWMNGQSYILGYFPFGYMAPPTGINPNMNLLNGDGSVTSLGGLILDKSGAK